MKDPIGIDVRIPRFFWNCEDGIRQSAYQLVMEDELGKTVWDTGKRESSQMTHIPYEGRMTEEGPDAIDYINYAKERLECAEEVVNAFLKSLDK